MSMGRAVDPRLNMFFEPWAGGNDFPLNPLAGCFASSSAPGCRSLFLFSRVEVFRIHYKAAASTTPVAINLVF